MAQPRKPAGSPTGGQFDGIDRPESEISLSAAEAAEMDEMYAQIYADDDTAAPANIWLVTKPGIVDDMPEDVYHADPVQGGSVSQSGVKKFLDCPAKFKYERDHPQTKEDTPDMEKGKILHSLVMGTGAEYEVLDFPNFLTKAAKEAKEAAKAKGKVPILTKDFIPLQEAAAALHRDPVAGPIFSPKAGGVAEQSMFMEDPDTGLWLRGRTDWVTEEDGVVYINDYKTARSASPEDIGKAIAEHGYHIQAAAYSWMRSELGDGQEVRFRFIFQEKVAPYVVTVATLDQETFNMGYDQFRTGLDQIAEAEETGKWPGYVSKETTVGLPAWAKRNLAKDGVGTRLD